MTPNQQLISIDEFIQKAKAMGIDLGKGDPENRIRYYIKSGLLPHQIRLKKGSQVVGHLPLYALSLLQTIEELKLQNKTPEEIHMHVQKALLEFELMALNGQNVTPTLFDRVYKIATLVVILIFALALYKFPNTQQASVSPTPPTSFIRQSLADGEPLSLTSSTLTLPANARYIIIVNNPNGENINPTHTLEFQGITKSQLNAFDTVLHKESH